MGGTGFFIDYFVAQQSEGIVWVHGYGNVFDVTLEAGGQIDVEPGGWVYKDRSVQMETQFQRFSTGLFAAPAKSCGNFSPAPDESESSPCTFICRRPNKTKGRLRITRLFRAVRRPLPAVARECRSCISQPAQPVSSCQAALPAT